MGRPRKPTAVKKLQGTLEKRRTVADEWTPPVGAPVMPEHLGPDGRRQWRLVVPILVGAGLVSPGDAGTLEAFCEAYQEWRDAARQVKAEGLIIATEYGPKQHPAYKTVLDARGQCMQYAARFGLDPASRSRISVPKPKVDEDKAEALLFGDLKVVAGGK